MVCAIATGHRFFFTIIIQEKRPGSLVYNFYINYRMEILLISCTMLLGTNTHNCTLVINTPMKALPSTKDGRSFGQEVAWLELMGVLQLTTAMKVMLPRLCEL